MDSEKLNFISKLLFKSPDFFGLYVTGAGHCLNYHEGEKIKWFLHDEYAIISYWFVSDEPNTSYYLKLHLNNTNHLKYGVNKKGSNAS